MCFPESYQFMQGEFLLVYFNVVASFTMLRISKPFQGCKIFNFYSNWTVFLDISFPLDASVFNVGSPAFDYDIFQVLVVEVLWMDYSGCFADIFN